MSFRSFQRFLNPNPVRMIRIRKACKVRKCEHTDSVIICLGGPVCSIHGKQFLIYQSLLIKPVHIFKHLLIFILYTNQANTIILLVIVNDLVMLTSVPQSEST